MLVSIPIWAKVVAAVALLAHLPIVLRQHALLSAPGATVAIEIGSDNIVSIQTRSAEWREYGVLGSCYVMPYLTVLNLRHSEGRATKRVALLPDSLHAEDFRKLRVWLRWKEDSEP
jgi:toxin CptA